MGTISFHVHGELAKNASIDSNVVVYISSVLYNNPAAEEAISAMRSIFTQDVAVPFANDWLTRTVQSGYLSGNVLRPPSSPIKAAHSHHERPTSVNPLRIARSPSPTPSSSSISTVSSLTVSALATHEIMSTPKHRGSQSTHCFPKPHAVPSTTGRSSTVKATQPTRSTLEIVRTVDGASPLSVDVKEFMYSIGKDTASNHDVIREIYNFTGRALWETTVGVRLDLNSGTAKALAGLMLNITTL